MQKKQNQKHSSAKWSKLDTFGWNFLFTIVYYSGIMFTAVRFCASVSVENSLILYLFIHNSFKMGAG